MNKISISIALAALLVTAANPALACGGRYKAAAYQPTHVSKAPAAAATKSVAKTDRTSTSDTTVAGVASSLATDESTTAVNPRDSAGPATL